ncbi:Clp protease proteolytic subunit /Translocation-enhancing protein TepA [uncultured Caudovirales phage]|uniref:Clp protease proteolytic subunit /Translocation-enhancing protein TepA n=1 Tax=uncultured Caudovirales phage TaxID=2100421 RepID=A0A6J7WLD0_9CAUD|nr:Clp protease proteolytic subunit /Translocation-enhancing protein TepA [uncultured Caudovirales phage]
MIGNVYIKGQIGNSYDENGIITKNGIELIDVVSQVQGLGEVDIINVHIDSEGGYVEVGRSIAQFISSLGNVNTIAENLCASIATEIHLSVPLNNRFIQEGTSYIIHNPFLMNVTGDASALEEMSKNIKETESEMINNYSKATGVSKEALSGLMKIETSLTTDQCLKLNFASAIVPKQQQRAVALIYNQKQTNMKKPLMERVALAMSILKGEEVVATVEREALALIVETDKGNLNVPYADIQIGDPVLMEDGTKPLDGVYTSTLGAIITVMDGLVTEFMEVPEPIEEPLSAMPTQEEMDKLTAENESLKAEIEALKLELDKANGVAETVVAKMEELAKVGSTFTPPAQATVFREVATPKTIKEQMAERKLISKNK